MRARIWVPEILGQIIMNMSREGKDFKWLGENTEDALMWSKEETIRVRDRVSVLENKQKRRRLGLVEEIDDDDGEDRRKEREEEELRVLLLGILPCGPPESQPDTEFIDLMERKRAKYILSRILVMMVLFELIVLDRLWMSFWTR